MTNEIKVSVTTASIFDLSLKITKPHSNMYRITVHHDASYEFISIIADLLKEYGDVFAAYVSTIREYLSIADKMKLFQNFRETIENTTVTVAKFDKREVDHNWGNVKVNQLNGENRTTDYYGHTYIFTRNN